MPLKTSMDEPVALNLTAMIDVLFNVLIFFLLCTTFATTERSMEVEVPQVSDKLQLSAAPQRRVVNVFRDGSVTLDEQAMSLTDLTRELAAAREQGAKLAELRTAFRLARLYAGRGRRVDSQELLAPILGGFSEGFDTPDLAEARALLATRTRAGSRRPRSR